MSSGDPRAKSTKRQSKSCRRCLKRKQRCHGFPVCSACEEARQPCEQSEYALQLHSRDSNYAAFKRIQTLEAQLTSALEELSTLRQGQQSLPASTPEFLLDQQNQAAQEQGPLPIPWIFNDGCTSSNNTTDYTRTSDPTIIHNQTDPVISSCLAGPIVGDDATQLVRDTDVDYGMVQETSMEQMVQATVWAKALSSVNNNVSNPTSGLPEPQNQNRSVPMPTDGTGRRMLETYFERIHPRYPFLEPSELYRLHARRYDQVLSTPSDRFSAFKLSMVYAIGGTLLKLTDPYFETQTDGFLSNALQNVSSVIQSNTLHTIEGMTLLVLYNLRSQANKGIWYMIGLAMRTCIDLGLHQESSYATGPSSQNHKKRRLFWSVYLLERIIALSLRRPFSIAEHEIETRTPSETDDYWTYRDARVNSETDTSNLKSTAKLTMWAKFIQIKRFESRIQLEVYCQNETRQQRFAKVESLLAQLDGWNQSLPPLAESENNYLQLHWNKAISQLLRPFLSMMRGDNPLISRCLKASGHICDIFKRMHQRESYGHSFVSAHSTFIAGVTMCYCLFLAPALFNNSVANSLRACSSTMFVIAERTHGLRKHRDILEDIIGRITDSPANPGGMNQTDSDDPQAHQCSQLDSIAVQSLLNLAAQQEPQELNDNQEPADGQQQQRQQQQSASMITLPITDNDAGPAPFVPVQPLATYEGQNSASQKFYVNPPVPELIEKPFDFSFYSSWDVDRYSLEMLDRMAGLDSRY